jgi:sugar-specific transcriptional regulator TrmB
MANDSEFITRLIGFGLSEKEAHLYYHLLKYGPKPPSLLAKSLKTYSEDIYRTLTGLIDKGMVNPSLETPTVYTAVELNIALDTALKKHESELREMERRKQQLQEISKQQRFGPSDEFTTYRIIKSVKEAQAFGMSVIPSLDKEILWTGPELSTAIFSLYGTGEASIKLIECGGCARGITDISHRAIETVQQHLNFGHDIRHIDKYSGIVFAVFDRKHALTGINIDFERITRRFSLDESCTFLLTDDPAYIKYLVYTFELLWKQAVPAAQRIEELLKEGPPQA